MNTIELIKALSASTSRTDKEQILMQAFMTGERIFFAGARLAYDYLVTFGVQKVALIEEEDDTPGTFSFKNFIELARRLAQRELTGNTAREAINAAAEICHVETWNIFYRRILLKDLNIGVEAKIINKILGRAAALHPEAVQFMIPIFGLQTAADGKKPEIAKKLVGNRFIEMEQGGTRLVTILDKENNMVAQFNRNGKINEEFLHITDVLKSMMNELPTSVVLDGEMVGTEKMQLALFDILPLSDFQNGRCNTMQGIRHDALCELQTTGLLKKYCGDSVYVIPKIMVDLSIEEGRAAMNEMAAGTKGIIVKDPDAPYITSRNPGWITLA